MKDEKRICLNKSVLDFMNTVLKQTSSPIVLEFGSGWSSSWFSKRCFKLITVETDRKWARIVSDDLQAKDFKNWHMILANPAPIVFVSNINNEMKAIGIGAEMVDLILIDCRENMRLSATYLGWLFLKKGGWILFDDAQRLQHKNAIDLLTEKAGQPIRLEWQSGDIDSAKPRLTLAWQKKGG